MRTIKNTAIIVQLAGALVLSSVGIATQAEVTQPKIEFTGSYISSWTDHDSPTKSGIVGFHESLAWTPAHEKLAWDNGDGSFLGSRSTAGPSEEPETSPSFLDARLLITLSYSDTTARNEVHSFCNRDLTDHKTSKRVLNMTVNRELLKNAMSGTLSGTTANNTTYAQFLSSPVPEASSLLLLILGSSGLLIRRRLKRLA